MSIPAFAWALEQGRIRNLPTSERMLLVVIADRGNGTRACYAGQACLAKDTGLKERQVRISLQRLEAEGLIRIERNGKSRLYHVLRPVNGEDHSSPPTPAHTAGELSTTPAHTAANKTPTAAQNAGVQRTTPARDARTPAHCAKNTGTECRLTLEENQEENLKPAYARASGEASAGQRAHTAPADAPTRRDQEAPPPVVEAEASVVDISAITAAVAAAIRSTRAPPPTAEPYVPIHRGPVDPVRTVEEQQAILAAMIAEEALAKAPRVMEAAE